MACLAWWTLSLMLLCVPPGQGCDEKDILYLSLSAKNVVSLPSSRTVQNCSVPEFPIKGLRSAVAGFIDNDLTICGGYDGTYYSTCHRLHNGKWVPQHGMTSKRGNAAASQTSTGLFITGGYDGNKRLSTTEVLISAGWVPGPSLPVAVSSHCQVTVTRDTVIVAGGYTGNAATSAVYALTGQTWTHLKSMRHPRLDHSCTLVNNILIVMGGRGRKDVELYDVITDTWTTGPSLPSDMSYGQAVTVNTQVIAVYRDGMVLQLSDDWKNWNSLDNIAPWGVSGGKRGRRPFFPAPLVTRKTLGC